VSGVLHVDHSMGIIAHHDTGILNSYIKGYVAPGCDSLIGCLTCVNATVCIECVFGYGPLEDNCPKMPVVVCFGVFSNQSHMCNNHGYCVATEVCLCKEGYASPDVACAHSICFGIQSNESSVCNNHGTCMGPNNCRFVSFINQFLAAKEDM